MTVKLTDRMAEWIETGCQIAVASAEGVPTVIIAPKATVTGDNEVAFPLREPAYGMIHPKISENQQVSFGVSGKMRAPYQFKGTATVATAGEPFDRVAAAETHAVLYVTVTEIYSTKPGSEAGKRLDVMPFEDLQAWEAERWTDTP